ncbi:MAG: beta-L-arabinofuranosidase domain-containing protein [Planctomycetota bacterium]
MNYLRTGLVVIAGMIWAVSAYTKDEPAKGYPVEPVPFTEVNIRDTFWSQRMVSNRKVTIPYDLNQCEETGRIRNFAVAGKLEEGKHEGHRYNDSDLFKVIEGAAYSLSLYPDPGLDARLDAIIAKIAAAQEEDGYLYTTRTIDPENPAPGAGETRWSNLRDSHELYNVGHLYEAAVAHFKATGKRTLLDVALKNADLIVSLFGPEGISDIPGHQEIEIGLCRLYLVTGKQKYLDLAKFFLDMRGRADKREIYGSYCQDHLPVTEQAEAVGHAVRAGYMYSAMADVAALTGNQDYIDAIDKIWDDVVSGKLYLTGGIGARHNGEAFGDRYELPNAEAYNETCAAIANAMWNHRLFLLHGDSRYIDVLERVLYNGFLSGVSLSGDRFFYPNPLASRGGEERSPWFGCSCCPTNVARFLPSLPGYVYAQCGDELYVNLFVSGGANLKLGKKRVSINVRTAYPWDGKIQVTVIPSENMDLTLYLRIPGWAREEPLPGGLYRFLEPAAEKPVLSLNNKEIPLEMDRGYARIQRTWARSMNEVTLELPMPVRRVVCREEVAQNQGRVALMRGPIVYCAEGVDNGGHTTNLVLPDEAKIISEFRSTPFNETMELFGPCKALFRDDEGGAEMRDQKLVAIPYYLWAHRGKGEMDVWLPRNPSLARVIPKSTVASESRVSASHVWSSDTCLALNDQLEPARSNDHGIPRFTWWPHKATREWVQYDFKEAREVSRAAVYWFDDTDKGGGCRVPVSWQVLYLHEEAWRPVETGGHYGVEKDRFNEVGFTPVRTASLRLEVTLPPDRSGGILEWRVE